MAKVKNVPDYPPEILSLDMYHSNVTSREEAYRIIRDNFKGIGTFLVRPNSSNDSSFVSISTSISNEEVCHVKVHISREGGQLQYFVFEKAKFSSFAALLEFYNTHRIHCMQKIDNVRLLNPVPAPKSSSRIKQRSEECLSVKSRDGQKEDLLDSQGEEKQSSSGSNDSGVSQTGAKAVSKVQLSDCSVHKKVGFVSSSSIPADISKMYITDSESGSGGAAPESQSRISESHQAASEAGILRDKPRSKSLGNIETPSILQRQKKERAFSFSAKYWNSDAIHSNEKMKLVCRPPAPLPRNINAEEDNDMYYTQVEENKNFFQETYRFLKENEECECGLLIVKSELPKNWTIHKSHEPSTKDRIFFQRDEETMWDMPGEIVNLLSPVQLDFILRLCAEGKCPVPPTLAKYLRSKQIELHARPSHSTASEPVSSSSSSGSSSGSTFASSSISRNSNTNRKMSLKHVTFAEEACTLQTGTESEVGSSAEQFDSFPSDCAYERPQSLFAALDVMNTQVQDNGAANVKDLSSNSNTATVVKTQHGAVSLDSDIRQPAEPEQELTPQKQQQHIPTAQFSPQLGAHEMYSQQEQHLASQSMQQQGSPKVYQHHSLAAQVAQHQQTEFTPQHRSSEVYRQQQQQLYRSVAPQKTQQWTPPDLYRHQQHSLGAQYKQQYESSEQRQQLMPMMYGKTDQTRQGQSGVQQQHQMLQQYQQKMQMQEKSKYPQQAGPMQLQWMHLSQQQQQEEQEQQQQQQLFKQQQQWQQQHQQQAQQQQQLVEQLQQQQWQQQQWQQQLKQQQWQQQQQQRQMQTQVTHPVLTHVPEQQHLLAQGASSLHSPQLQYLPQKQLQLPQTGSPVQRRMQGLPQGSGQHQPQKTSGLTQAPIVVEKASYGQNQGSSTPQSHHGEVVASDSEEQTVINV